MTENMDNTSPTEVIDNNIALLERTSVNRIKGIFLDETLSELYGLPEPMVIPVLPVKEIDIQNSVKISAEISSIIPQYLSKHRFLEKRKPSSEQHALHFIMPVSGSVIDFVHILRLDFRFSGKAGKIISKGDTERYPSFEADRIYFKSRIVPVAKGSDPFSLESVRLKDSIGVESDKRIFTSVIFDEFSNREISIEFSKKPGIEIFQIPVKIYPFIIYEYFTACLSIPDPNYDRIINGARIFEPLFFCLYFNYRTSGRELDISSAAGFTDYLEISGDKVLPKERLIKEMKDYFSSYSIFTDDELLLRGWKKLIYAE